MSEKLYDEVIAPKIMEVCKLCEQNGIPFVGLCEFERGEHGRTEYLPDSASLEMHIAAYAARCHANVDALMIAITRYCQRKGIDTKGSMFMSISAPRPPLSDKEAR